MSIPTDSAAVIFTDKEKAVLSRAPVSLPKEGEVLVRATWSLISTGTETICYGRRFAAGTHWDNWVKYPFHPGYSHVGIVEAVGPGVVDLKLGDHVASGHVHREYVSGPAQDFSKIPSGVSDRDAAWMTLSYIVQNGVRRAEHELGQDVVVVGLGPLGQLATQFARNLGARIIVAVDPVALRLDMAKSNGATHTLAMSVDDAQSAVKDLTHGRMADILYDMTGNDKVFASSQKLLRRLGKLALIGDTGTPAGQFLTSDVMRKSLRIIASHANNIPIEQTDWNHWTQKNMVDLFFQYLLDGRMRVSNLSTHEFAPSQAQEAYQMLLHNRAETMGCYFNWSKS